MSHIKVCYFRATLLHLQPLLVISDPWNWKYLSLKSLDQQFRVPQGLLPAPICPHYFGGQTRQTRSSPNGPDGPTVEVCSARDVCGLRVPSMAGQEPLRFLGTSQLYPAGDAAGVAPKQTEN